MTPEPTRADIDSLVGPTVVEFGTSWCGVCRAAQPAIAAALSRHPAVRHVRVEDVVEARLAREIPDGVSEGTIGELDARRVVICGGKRADRGDKNSHNCAGVRRTD